MKILFPIGSFYPTTFGGPGTILYWHGVYLKKHGHQPIVVTTTEGIIENVVSDEFLELPCGKVYYGKGGVLKLKTILTMFAQVKHVDLIHLTSLFSPISIICFLYAHFFYKRVKIIWSVRGELNPTALAISKNKKRLLLGIYKQLAKQLVFASTSLKETIEIKVHFKNNDIIEVPNVMPTSNRIERAETDKRFLFLGRIHPIKNLESLIEGFYKSKAFKNPSSFLDIAGVNDKRDVAYLQSLKSLVNQYKMEHKVVFLGHKSGLEKETLLANAYFLVLPSHTENFGNVVIEALNQGTPVIASAHTPWEELEQYKCGFWVENTPKELADIIDKTLELSVDKYNSYRLNSIKIIEEQYSIETRIHDWIHEYEKSLN